MQRSGGRRGLGRRRLKTRSKPARSGALGRRGRRQRELLHQREQLSRGSELTLQICRRAFGAAGVCKQLLRLLDQRRQSDGAMLRADVTVSSRCRHPRLRVRKAKDDRSVPAISSPRHASAGCPARARQCPILLLRSRARRHSPGSHSWACADRVGGRATTARLARAGSATGASSSERCGGKGSPGGPHAAARARNELLHA